jgi:WD40 repeat protein
LGAKERVYLWNLQSGSLIQTFPLGNDIPTALAFHPQGLFLAIAPYASEIQLWRLSDGSVQALASEEYAASNDYTSYKSVAFSPDGQFLTDGNFEAGEVWLWRIPTGQLVQQMKPAGGRVQGLAFSPDGQLLVCGEAGGFPNHSEMRVWNMQTKQAIQGFLQQNWHPTFRSDGKLLAAGNLSSITIWDVVTRNRIRQFSAHTGRFHRLTFSPSGRFLVSIGDRKRTVRWWEIETGQEIYRMS